MSELESKPGLLDCKTRIPNCQTSLTDTLSHVWGEEILAHFRWKESGRRQVYKVDVGWDHEDEIPETVRTVQLIKDLAREIRLVEVRIRGAGEAFGKGLRLRWKVRPL